MKPLIPQINAAIRVHAPQWRDAADHVHGPGRDHGQPGIITSIDEDRVGCDQLCCVTLTRRQRARWYWVSELRPALG